MSADGMKPKAFDPGGFSGERWPVEEADIADWTDHYFRRTKEAVGRFGDAIVTYALFLRRPVISAPRLAIDWLHEMAARRKVASTSSCAMKKASGSAPAR